MTICNDKPDIIMVTEVIPKAQCQPISPALLSISGYTFYTNFYVSLPKLGRSGKCGICVFVSDVFIVSQISFSPSSLEQVWIELRLVGSDKLLLGCIYCSPSGDTHDSVQQLISTMKEACDYGASHLMIVGDFNLPQIDWENESSSAPDTHPSHCFIECVQNCFLYQHVRQPTRNRMGEVPSVLDVIFTNEQGMVTNVEYLPGSGSSDHVVLKLSLICYSGVRTLPFAQRTRIDYEKLKTTLASVNWTPMTAMNMENAYSFFKEKMSYSVDMCSHPSSTKSKTKNLYMNGRAIQLKKRKAHLWKHYTRTHDVIDHARYATCRNSLRRLTRKLRKNYERQLVSRIKEDPKAFWTYTSSRLKARCRVGDLRDDTGTVFSSNQDKASILNSFFSSVFTEEGVDDPPELTCELDCPPVDDIDLSTESVARKLSSLKPSSAPGPDSIHPRVLRDSASTLATPLHILFRKSIDSGTLPLDWKTGNVVPIYKKGDRQSPSNYRPVSLTSVPSKVLETFVRDCLISHMSELGLFHTAQHGFMPKRSCSTQLLEVMEDWSSAFEDGQPLDVTYLDFAKAFDSVPHKRLLSKLKAYGVRGKLLRWVESFLTGRLQRVLIQGDKSDWCPVTSGIPQGSVLGPTLFIIYINDLPTCVTNRIGMFADDTKVYCRVPPAVSISPLQQDLDALVQWSEKWLLHFNASKCKVMHIGSRNPCLNYNLCGVIIDEVLAEKDLGVVMNCQLNFHE